MAIFFTRTYVVPAWILMFGLVFFFWPPATGVATSVLLLLGGGFLAPILIVFLCDGIPRFFQKR